MSLSSLPVMPVPVFWGMVAVCVGVSVLCVRAARDRMRRGTVVSWLLWFCAIALLVVGAGPPLLSSRCVHAQQIGVGKTAIYEEGAYVFPKEAFIPCDGAGMFSISYPNERSFLLVEYKVKYPEKLLPLYNELVAFKFGPKKDPMFVASGLDESSRHGTDPLASYMYHRVKERCPHNPAAEGHVQYSVGPILQALSDRGVIGRVSLVRKDLLSSTE